MRISHSSVDICHSLIVGLTMPCVSVRDQLRVTAVFPTTTTTKMTAGKEVSILEIISSDREICL